MTLCEPQTQGKILCIRLSGLGDIVHSLNALSLLRKSRPSAHISWITEERFASLIEDHPHIDELITIPRFDWGRSLKNPLRWGDSIPEITELAIGLRREHFDVTIDFQSSSKSAWMVAAAAAPLRIGFAPPVSREMSHLVQNRLVNIPKNACHRIERNLCLLSPMAIPSQYFDPVLPVGKPHEEVITKFTSELPRPLVVIHPGTSEFAKFKRWIPERYGRVAEHLIDKHNASVIVTFGPGEEALAHRVIWTTSHRAHLAPRLAHLQQLAALLREADLFIGSDTGPMHMASALNTPVVSLFGPKDPKGTGPMCSPARVIRAGAECSPCTKRQCPNPICMSRISVGMVNKAATELIENPPLPRCAAGITPLSGSTSFELGDWKGKINASFSMPGFYKQLAQISSNTSTDKNGFPHIRFKTDEATGQHIIMKSCETTSSRTIGRSWKNAVELWHKSVPMLMPVCFMTRDKASQDTAGAFMLFQKKAPKANNIVEHADETLSEIATLMCQLHNSGFHILGSPEKNFRLDDKGRVILAGFEDLFKIPLPPVAREYMWSKELRRLFHSLTFTNTERKRFFTTYAQALNSPRILKKWIAKQTRIVFLDEDTLR